MLFNHLQKDFAPLTPVQLLSSAALPYNTPFLLSCTSLGLSLHHAAWISCIFRSPPDQQASLHTLDHESTPYPNTWPGQPGQTVHCFLSSSPQEWWKGLCISLRKPACFAGKGLASWQRTPGINPNCSPDLLPSLPFEETIADICVGLYSLQSPFPWSPHLILPTILNTDTLITIL